MRPADAVRARLAPRRALLTMLWRAAGWRILGVGVLAVAQGLAPTAAILATGIIIDAVHTPDGDRAVLGLVLFGGALLVRVVLTALLDYLVRVLDGRYGQVVHDTIARATLRTPHVAALEEPAVVGELASLAEFERVDGFVRTVSQLREVVQRRATGLGSVVVLVGFAWWMPLVLLVAWRGLAHGVRRWIDHGVGLKTTVGARMTRRPRYLRGLAVDAPAAKEVRLFGLAGWLVDGYADSYREALRHIWTGRALGMRSVLAGSAGLAAAHLLVLGTAGWQALTGALSVAQLVVLVQAVLGTGALGFLGEPELTLGRARQVARQALRLEQTLRPARTATRTAGRPAPGGALPVRLTGVRFTYPTRTRPTLDGLDLEIPAGQSVAVVGGNGAGKSTLIKVLCGLYEPDLGRVEIGGHPPGGPDNRIGAIFQNFTRYELPLRANVGFGSPGAGQEVLTAALADAGAGDLPATLRAGWDTVLSAGYPDGQDLSGGQWQKVALARALAAVRGGAGLLVLDEPTAALDVRAEAELFDRFRAATTGVTTILVSHRLASVCRADRIVVIDDGRVVEDGTHEDLMAAGGRYAAMFTLQAERFVPAAPRVAAREREPARG
ncbi:ATP-binding cassette domain-containing protein [Actinophytocola gossypii]|uniref:ABC transporter ATP-binding protein n=1 Tax=Actinophytocola gossypii TaxID=2812003 RepID=A0ABT2JH43_9PSEU|nr:ABC transporter ATP-binding protein [Actinophytocola gossypii]MCT2587058.1 ABC transporter ATP-binding protein [Actinophytocola gossypii]